MHRNATTHYWSTRLRGALLVAAFLMSSPATAESLREPIAASDWVLSLEAPDTVYPGIDIVARVSLKSNSSLPKYVYSWMSAGLRQNTMGEFDVEVRSEDGATVRKTIESHPFISFKEARRRLFVASDSMTTYEFVYVRFYQRSNREGRMLPPGVYQLTATCRLSESVPGERPRLVLLRSRTSPVVIATPPGQYAAAYAQFLLATQKCQESKDRRRWSTRDAALDQLRSLATEYVGTRIGASAATALVSAMMYDVGYGRSSDLGRLARETGNLLLANADDGLQVPWRAWGAYRFVRNRDRALAQALLMRLASASPGTRLAETVRWIARQEAAGANGGLR